MNKQNIPIDKRNNISQHHVYTGHGSSRTGNPEVPANQHWMAYSYPFIPMMDLRLAVDELKKLFQRWFLKTKKR